MNRLIFAVALAACSGSTPQPQDAGSDAGQSIDAGCPLTAATSSSGRINGTCEVLVRDTSGCRASRLDAGVDGFWLDFSCRVTLTASAQQVRARADSQPDYRSNFFPTTSACWESYTPQSPNPNQIGAQDLVIDFPRAQVSSPQAMGLGITGLALNGVAIFANTAAPGMDIYDEAATFDRCQAHPTQRSQYHYHSEPYAISYDDAAFIGVMRDGYPVYGRRDGDGGVPVLDTTGGHVGTTPHSPATPLFHYHVNEQVSTNPGSAGRRQWFITTGTYQAAPGVCTGC